MTFYFKGQVKIEDVKRELDAIVTSINEIIDAYNASDYVKEMDYTIASPTLAPSGYTLTVGGLKKILDAYENNIVGFKVFYLGVLQATGNPEYLVTDGILFKADRNAEGNITKRNIIRVPRKVISGNGQYLYYNTSTNLYEIADTKPSDNKENSNLFFISKLNNNRDIKYSNTATYITEEHEGFKITIPAISSSHNHNMPLTSQDTPCVVAGNEETSDEGWGWRESFLLSKPANANNQPGRRSRSTYWFLSWLLLPKKVQNPFTYSNGAYQKVWNVNFTKPEQ